MQRNWFKRSSVMIKKSYLIIQKGFVSNVAEGTFAWLVKECILQPKKKRDKKGPAEF